MSSNPIVVSFATDESKAVNLVRSCAKFGWPLRIVNPGEFRGWGHRLKSVLAEVPRLLDEGYTHMIHVDAYDVVAVSYCDDLIKEDLCMGVYAHFFTEINCWPDKSLKDHKMYQSLEDSVDHPWRYVSSQFALNMKCLDHLQESTGFGILGDTDDDQLHCHQVVIRDWENRSYLVRGDWYSEDLAIVESIAFCHPYYAYYSTRKGWVENTVRKSSPYFLHGNGKTDMQWAIDFALGDTK